MPESPARLPACVPSVWSKGSYMIGAVLQKTARSIAKRWTDTMSGKSRRMSYFGNGISSKGKFEYGDRIWVYHGNSLDFMKRWAQVRIEGIFDMIFADPPYFLSNGGITCRGGKMASVDKGAWDKSQGVDWMHDFNRKWLALCQHVLKPDGTIWVSGTAHAIHSVGFAMQQLGFKLLNDITWVKPNPPPNLSCRYFTHATETVIWAARDRKSKHRFNYQEMKSLAGGKQMKSVWGIFPPCKEEKRYGRHPTQKPIGLVERIILASTVPGGLIFDPFLGTGATAVAAVRHKRHVVGVEADESYWRVAVRRIKEELSLNRGNGVT